MESTNKADKKQSKATRQLCYYKEGAIHVHGGIYIPVDGEWEIKNAFDRSITRSGFKDVATTRTKGGLEATVYLFTNTDIQRDPSYRDCEFIIDVSDGYLIKVDNLIDFFEFSEKYLLSPMLLPKVEEAIEEIEEKLGSISSNLDSIATAFWQIAEKR
jgi:hypothetical protein